MIKQDKQAFWEILTRLGEVYSRKLSEIAIEEYWESLATYQIGDIRAAVIPLKRKCKRFPTIADFADEIKAINNERRSKMVDYKPARDYSGEVSEEDRKLWLVLTRWLWNIPENCKAYAKMFTAEVGGRPGTLTYEESYEWFRKRIEVMRADPELVADMKEKIDRATGVEKKPTAICEVGVL